MPVLGLAAGLGALRSARDQGGDWLRRRQLIATAFAAAGSVLVVVVCFVLLRSVFDPGSVTHHSAEGKPPIAGILGTLALWVSCAVVAVANFRRRRSGRSADLRQDRMTAREVAR